MHFFITGYETNSKAYNKLTNIFHFNESVIKFSVEFYRYYKEKISDTIYRKPYLPKKSIEKIQIFFKN